MRRASILVLIPCSFQFFSYYIFSYALWYQSCLICVLCVVMYHVARRLGLGLCAVAPQRADFLALASKYTASHEMWGSIDNSHQALSTNARIFGHRHISLETAYTEGIQHPPVSWSYWSFHPSLTCSLPCASLVLCWRSNGVWSAWWDSCSVYAGLAAYCYLLQIPIVFQQVSAFMEHSHFPLFKQLLRWLGLSSRLAETINATARAPVSRRRILLCCDPSLDLPWLLLVFGNHLLFSWFSKHPFSKDLISYHETLLFLFLLWNFNLMHFVSNLILNIFQLGICIPALGLYFDDCVQ